MYAQISTQIKCHKPPHYTEFDSISIEYTLLLTLENSDRAGTVMVQAVSSRTDGTASGTGH